jgi:hypothetical protein
LTLAGRLCIYAARPDTRPDCEVTAVLRRGNSALCASCDTRRSTLGKGARAVPVRGGPVSLLEWISQARARLAAAETELVGAVTRARQDGQSWAAIAASLGTTRQAAQQRFGARRRT